jgi:hypothetical protein
MGAFADIARSGKGPDTLQKLRQFAFAANIHLVSAFMTV